MGNNTNSDNSKINTLKYYIDLALEFRLSLSDLCKLLGKEDTIESRIKLYNIFLNEVYSDDSTKKQQMNYLFNFESLKFPSKLNKARAFDLYVKRLKSNPQSSVQSASDYIRNTLYQTELRYNNSEERTMEDIARLRLKHCISQLSMANALGISRAAYASRESRIQDDELKGRLKNLNEYYITLTYETYHKKR